MFHDGRYVMNIPGNFASEDDPRTTELRTRMDAFYQSTASYSAFQTVNDLPQQWRHVHAAIVEILKEQPICRVLEIGSGMSGFSQFAQDIRSSLCYTAQDVTRANEEHLRSVADAVHFGSITELEGEFDVIFSTFVFEHISDPRRTLEKLFGMLRKGGKLFIFCPRYDMPFYLSHSADHYGVFRRFGIAISLLAARFQAFLTRQPLFLIHTDPAVLHIPWTTDRDAIHWASLWDLQLFFRGCGLVKRLRIPTGSTKDWIVKNLLQINVAITRLD